MVSVRTLSAEGARRAPVRSGETHVNHTRRRVRLGAAVTTLALLAAPAAASAQDAGTEGQTPTSDAVLADLEAAAEDAGVPPEAVLDQEVTVELPGEDGQPEPVTLTVEEFVLEVAGRSVISSEDHTGFLGLPHAGAGNLMHVYVDVVAATHSLMLPTNPAVPDMPAEEDLLRYDVAEAGLTPSTPIVPVINPLLLAGGLAPLPETPEEVPSGSIAVLDQPLLGAHWGGKLTSVQGSDYTTGFHSAGTTALGTSVDTEDVSEDPEAQAPIRLPLIEEGDLAVPDTAIDYLGFATVSQSGECSRLSLSVYYIGYACVTVGVLLGDGAATFDGEGPLDLRNDLAPLWEPAPAPLDEVIAAVDEAIAQLPVGDVLDLVGDLPLDDVPEVPTASVTTVLRKLRLF